MIRNPLIGLPPRILYLAMGMAVLLLLLGSWLYLFQPPLAEYRRLQASRIEMQTKVEEGSLLELPLEQINSQIARLNQRLRSDKPLLPVTQLVAQTVDKLDRLSKGHEVRLLSVIPGKTREVSLFEELPFAIKVQGDYFKLYEWLCLAEHELGPMVVKAFELRPLPNEVQIEMNLSLVSYRPLMEAL